MIRESILFSLNPSCILFKSSRLSAAPHTVRTIGPGGPAPRLRSGQTGNLEKNPGSREGTREESTNRTQFNYLYLIAVPVSLTLIVLMPQMQFMS